VQGLRALAVTMVVVYHLYPSLVPGGFAGVDVFFVISGFLITGHLWREHRKAGTVSLTMFWGRRARRLIPAAALVLAVTWAASLRFLPPTQLPETAAQVRASALYFQNWQLAADAVDYLKSDQASSPVQHFWSLSVEEQFYLLWPLLFIAAAVVASLLRRRRNRPAGEPVVAARGVPGHRVLGCLTVVVVGASLAYSVHETRFNPATAYFITPTRIWELGAGGLLALLPERIAARVARLGWLSWAGLALAVASAFVLRGTSAFPGYLALLPVVGTVLLIACGSAEGRLGTGRVTSLRPLVFLGGISYSLYLWHWPLITLWSSWRQHPIGLLAGPFLAVASVLLAWLTKVLVEDPVRQARFLRGHDWRSVSVAVAAAVPVALVLGLMPQLPSWNGELGPGYPGAAALADAMSASDGSADAVVKALASVPAKPMLPPPGTPANQARPAYWNEPGCLLGQPDTATHPCTFGDTAHPARTVALVGDSIAGNWFPALNVIALQQHWKLVTELHGNCVWTATMMWYDSTDGPYAACHQWGVNVLHDLLTTVQPDVVITTGNQLEMPVDNPVSAPSARAETAAGEAAYWRQLEAHGIGVIALAETPSFPGDLSDCIARNSQDPRHCAAPRSTVLMPDPPTSYAARDMGGTVPLVDMNSFICGPRQCDPVVGNVRVYLDEHHLTAAYSQTLAPYLKMRLRSVSPALFGLTRAVHQASTAAKA